MLPGNRSGVSRCTLGVSLVVSAIGWGVDWIWLGRGNAAGPAEDDGSRAPAALASLWAWDASVRGRFLGGAICLRGKSTAVGGIVLKEFSPGTIYSTRRTMGTSHPHLRSSLPHTPRKRRLSERRYRDSRCDQIFDSIAFKRRSVDLEAALRNLTFHSFEKIAIALAKSMEMDMSAICICHGLIQECHRVFPHLPSLITTQIRRSRKNQRVDPEFQLLPPKDLFAS